MFSDSASLAQVIERFRSRAFKPKRIDASRATATHTRDLQKSLTSVDLVFLGIGGIIGAGVFVLTGTAAKEDAGYVEVVSCSCWQQWMLNITFS